MSAKKLPVVRVAVCGLTSSSFSGMSGQGAGKSCLCNRFVRPKRDDLCLNHSSILTHSDFGSSVVNNDPFLYWGEKIAALEDGSVAFQIVEHTEFVQDGSLQLFQFAKPYHKRCIQQKLASGGKVQYLHPNQLVAPDEYSNAGKFPEKFVVDGYIICIDVSDDLDNPKSEQRMFLDRLLPAIIGVKRAHIVIAFTKFDIAKEPSITAANEFLSKYKRQMTVIEVSALEGVNVDVCFLVLAHLVDSKRPRTRISSFTEAYSHLKERVRKNEKSFQTVLSSKITDFSLSLSRAQTLLENEVEYFVLRELCGQDRVTRLIRAQLRYLTEDAVKRKLANFLDHLQASLQLFLCNLSLSDTLETCKETIRTHDKFSVYFMENKEWRDDFSLLKDEEVTCVPFSILEESEGERILQQHMDMELAPQREDAACDIISTTLQNAANLTPGRPMEEVMRELGLADHLAAVPSQRALQIYQERMALVEQDCVSDIVELLLEHPQLFTLSEAAVLTTINTQLKDDVRYQRLEKHASTRTSAIIKHIGVMKWPDKSPYAESHILEANPLLDVAPSQEMLSKLHGHPDQTDGSNSSNWILDLETRSFNLAVLGRTNENALTLRSDFMNHMSGSCMCEVHGKRYQIELAVYHDNITALHSTKFSPQGAVAVVNSEECLIWLEQVLQSLWIPFGDAPSLYRGLPLVILALDDSIMDSDAMSGLIPDTPFGKGAKQLADQVQCVLMVERPTVQPKRLVVTSVISSVLTSLFDSVSSYAEFLSYDLVYKPNALNVAVCTLAGDPYSPQDLLSPWLQHQAVCCDKKGKSLFINCVLEKQHSIVNLTFHSSLNILDLKKRIHAGYILVYSPHRQASLAILKHVLSQLLQIPTLIVAMVTDDSCDSHVTKEGQQLAEQYEAAFLASNSHEWGVGCSSAFFSKCWYSRFTSWHAQNFNPRRSIKDRPLPQPVSRSSLLDFTAPDESSSAPVPPLPTSSSSSRSQSPSRPHSIAGLLNSDTPLSPTLISPPPISTGSLPRPSQKKTFKQTGGQRPEDLIYSDPADIAMGNEQKKQTLQRRHERENTLPRTPGTPLSPSHTLLIHMQRHEDSTYADPKDLIKFPHEPSGVPLRCSSVSAPPPPPTGPPVADGSIPLGAAEELYATVQSTSSRHTPGGPKSPSSEAGRGYDHLARQMSELKYDHLSQDEETIDFMNPGEQRLGERPPAPLPECPPLERPPPPLSKYSPVHLPKEPQNMYATVDTTKKTKAAQKKIPSPVNTARTPEPLTNSAEYATVDTSRKKKKSFTTLPVTGDNGYAAAEKGRKLLVPSPPTVAKGSSSEVMEGAQIYATVDMNKKRKRTPPPVLPKSPQPPVAPALNGDSPEFSRGSRERQRKPTAPLLKNGSHFKRKSNESLLTPGSMGQLHLQHQTQHYRPDNATGDLYALPIRKPKKPAPPTAPKPRRSPSPAPGATDSAATKSLPRGKSFDLDDRVSRTSTSHSPRRVGSPQLGHRNVQVAQHMLDDKSHLWDPRTRTSSDPHFQSERERGRGRRRVPANYAVRVGSSDNVWRENDESVRSGAGEKEDADAMPLLPERRYSPLELGLEDEPPPLPPRNYNWSDVEDDDEDLFQSEDELEESSSRISLDDQQAMYSSLRLYQKHTNSMSGIEELYAIVNQVAKEQEATQKPSSQYSEPGPVINEAANVYDTLESALKQKEQLEMKKEVTAAMKKTTGSGVPPETSPQKTHPVHTQSALGALGGAGAAVFTPKQLKLIKQQQKLLDKLQKKTEREAERRRKSEVRRKRREEDEQRKREGRRRGKKNKTVKELERQRYFGSPLEKVVESDGVPRFIKQCTQIIEAKGLKMEGMYRVSGKKDACLFLQDQYDQDCQLDVASLDLCETAISSTLKAFFKLLPEPLISNDIAATVLDVNVDNVSDQKQKLKLILEEMPVPNLNTLRYLMLHLHKVQQLQEINKMTSTNLAIVFWPTLMRPPLTDLADPSKQLCWQLMMARLIEHPDIVPEVC